MVERAKRAGRGAGMAALISQAEDDEEDEFWSKNEDVAAVFAEEENDEGYETERSEEDLADSDFFESESDSDDDGGNAEADAQRNGGEPKKKTLRAPGAASAPGAKQAAQLAARRKREQQRLIEGQRGMGAGVPPQAPLSPTSPTTSSMGTRKKKKEGVDVAKRQSVRGLAVANRAARQAAVVEAEAHQAEVMKRKRDSKPRAKRKEEPLTQRFLLQEATVTEVINMKKLEELLAREEETKRKAVKVKKKYAGPLIKFVDSATKGRSLGFTGVETAPRAINSRAPPYPPQVRCVVSGKRARYFDPVTQKPYADIAAFKQLREQHGAAMQR